MSELRPRIKTPSGPQPPYPLNKFPRSFHLEIGKRLIREIYQNALPKIEGSTWEQIFADAIGAQWVNSPDHLDDVRLKNCAWSGKTVFSRPTATRVPLISGRNNIQYSYNKKVAPGDSPNEVGELVLKIWNARVSHVLSQHEHLRTVVLLKSLDLRAFSIFEKNTVLYPANHYSWEWNRSQNLIGFDPETRLKRFTWQVNGQQFTIHDDVPEEKLSFKLHIPTSTPPLEQLLDSIGYDDSWITII